VNVARLSRLIRKEFRQMLRDPRSRRMLFVSPIIQLLIFGYAVNTDVRNSSTMIVDGDRTATSRALIQTLGATGYFDIQTIANTPADLTSALDRGTVLMGVDIPRGFAADLASGRSPHVQILVDGSTANTANIALGYATQIITAWGLQQTGRRADGQTGSLLGVDFRVRAWYNPDLESRAYNVPAVMGNIVMMMALLLTSLAIVRERELGTLEQLMVSPLTPGELIIGKTVPASLIALADMVLVTAVSLLWFKIPFQGSFLLLTVSSLIFILTGLGVGLLISTISNTQQEAFMSMFLFFLPAMMLSGMMFPVENMPTFLQQLTLLDPIRHYLVIVRGVFLRGTGWGILWPQMLILLAIGLLTLGFATLRFHKTTA
jgi:ABC-2 type transport system permease protein